ncbi:MAG: hypothetical protein AB1750_10335, partial [Chloroflexota bacterium]
MESTHRVLIQQTQAWARGRGFDAERARETRRQAILANHRHYLETIPAYCKFAEEEGIGALDSIEPIKQRLMFPDDIFKSYDQRWLDEKNFARMNAWLSEIHHRRVEVDVSGVDSIDAWIERLETAGLQLIYSSGTSGNFSFIPRDAANMELFRAASLSYLVPLFLSKVVRSPLQRMAIGLVFPRLSPTALMNAGRQTGGLGLSNFEAVFLDFNRGHTGNQSIQREVARLFRRASYLYETELSPTVLRLAARGPRTESDRLQLLALQDLVIGRKESNQLKIASR